MQKRFLAFGVAAVVAALPAVTGLAGNASFSQNVPVRAPASAQPVPSGPSDDHSSRTAEPADHHGSRTAEPADHHGSRTAEPADHHGSRTAEPADHRGSSGSGHRGTSAESGGRDDSSGRR